MELTEETADFCTVLLIEGRLDTATYGALDAKLTEMVGRGAPRILVDCTKLDYVSSAGIRMLLSVLKRLKAVGGNARFCALIKPVKQVFDIAGLSFRVSLFPTLEEALAGFPSSAAGPA